MTETTHVDGKSDGTWPNGNHREPVPDTSPLPGAAQNPPAAVNLLNRAVQGAHDTIDQLADHAAPLARQLGEGVAAAAEALQAKSDHLGDTRDEWVESVRTTVRSHPLVAVAAALALGAVIAGVTGWGRAKDSP